MSHFTTVQTKITSLTRLEQVLTELKFNFSKAEAGQLLNVNGYLGQKAQAQIVIHASRTYDIGVNVDAQTGAALTLDGSATTAAFTPIGTSGYGVARIKLTGGNHAISGDRPFGIAVYGYGAYTSYMYPGGLNLAVGKGP